MASSLKEERTDDNIASGTFAASPAGIVFCYFLVGTGILVLFGMKIGSAAAWSAGANAVGAVVGISGGLIMRSLSRPKKLNDDGEAEESWYGRNIIALRAGLLDGLIAGIMPFVPVLLLRLVVAKLIEWVSGSLMSGGGD